MKHFNKLLLLTLCASLSCNVYSNDINNKKNISQSIKKTSQLNDVSSYLLTQIQEQKDKIINLSNQLTSPIKAVSYDTFFADIDNQFKKLVESNKSKNKSVKVKKNQYGGYDPDVELTPEEFKVFSQSPEFIAIQENNTKTINLFFHQAQEIVKQVIDTMDQNKAFNKTQLDSMVIPKLPALTDKQKSFMPIKNIFYWEQLRQNYVKEVIQPYLDKLYLMVQINEAVTQLDHLEEMLYTIETQMKQSSRDIQKMGSNPTNSDNTLLNSSHSFVKDKKGNIKFQPHVEIKKPDISGLTSRCHLLNDKTSKNIKNQ